MPFVCIQEAFQKPFYYYKIIAIVAGGNIASISWHKDSGKIIFTHLLAIFYEISTHTAHHLTKYSRILQDDTKEKSYI
jgi:hypothetical protein